VVGTVLAALATASWVGVRALTGSRSVLTPVQACPPWQFVDAPSLGGYNNFLYGAASAGPDDVWAVGSRITELGNAALAEHWTGTSWGTVTGPSVGRYDSLYAVAAASPRDVWAVGATETDHIGRTLTVHWDGSRWSLVPSPSPSPSYSQLFGISAVASNDVWAVGTYRAAHPVGSGGLGPFRNLIEHWDGTRWTVIATPNTTPKDSWVNAVSPVAADDVWAVGQTTSTRTLALHWGGRRWRVVPTPNRDRASVLQSVSALASDDVWAVGFWDKPLDLHVLVERWDGRSWSIVPAPDPGRAAQLNAVLSLGPSDSWAAGKWWSGNPSVPSSLRARSLIEHWDGHQWSVISSPNRSVPITALSGLAGAPGANVWAVGMAFDGDSSLGGRVVTMRSGSRPACRSSSR